MIVRLLILAFVVFTVAAPARAHDSRPLYVEIVESGVGDVSLKWMAPASIAAGDAPVVALGAPCTAVAGADNAALRGLGRYQCAAGVKGATLSITYPVFNPSISTLARIRFRDGQTRTAVLEPSQTSWTIPAPDTFAGVARSYLELGVEHILGGVDHLLFLAGLLFIAGSLRRILITVTGFTLAHSLTLILTALNVVRVSIPATEAVIALSIVFLASEIARNDKSTLAWRRPVLVASTFGLVHGAGFAAALGQIGLPSTEKLAALLFFNFGVELGQLAVVLGIFAAIAAARRFAPGDVARITADARVAHIGGYALGIVAAYWFVERMANALLGV